MVTPILMSNTYYRFIEKLENCSFCLVYASDFPDGFVFSRSLSRAFGIQLQFVEIWVHLVHFSSFFKDRTFYDFVLLHNMTLLKMYLKRAKREEVFAPIVQLNGIFLE